MVTIGLFTVLTTADLPASRTFYERFFGMQAAFVCDWYVQLIHPTTPTLQLGLIVRHHESMPSPDQIPNAAAIVTIEVADADAMYRTLSESKAAVHGEPRDEPWGQRHFFTRDPGGYWLDVVQRIAPSAEYSAAYIGVS